MDIRRGILLIGSAALVVGVAGCAAPVDSGTGMTPSPTVSTPTPTPTPTADAASDEALLPIPPDDILAWAETAVPSPAPGDGTGILSGWLSQHTSARHLTTFTSLEPGAFQGQIACRGDGTFTLTAEDVDGRAVSEPVSCSNETIAFDAVTSARGITIVLDLDGPPTIYAVSLLRIE